MLKCRRKKNSYHCDQILKHLKAYLYQNFHIPENLQEFNQGDQTGSTITAQATSSFQETQITSQPSFK